MTQSDDWEPINYHNLPHWMKRVSKPKHWIENTYTKIFYSKPFNFKVKYSVVHGKLHINYWKSTQKTINKPDPKSFPIIIYLLIIVVLAGVGFVLFIQYAPSNITPFPIIISPEITASRPTVSSNPTPVLTASPPTLIHTPLPTRSLTPIPTTPNNNFKQTPKTTSYSYIVGGNRDSISFTTYGGLADYFSKESHTYRYDAEKEVIVELLENDYQDEYLQPLIEAIRKKSNNPDTQAKIAISFVQHIPYNWKGLYGISMDWYYPYETLHNNKGVCADKSLLLAFLLNELGYDTVLFEFSNHMAVGVKSSSNYDFYDTGYAFIETTRPTIITFIPDTYYGGFTVSSNPHIIHLNGGKKVLDVSNEYRDALTMKQLEAMGQVLDQSHYAEWSKISNNYNLQYNT